ncbi:MAG TPA: hypothetical protein VJN18_21530 [Polyangiaceae bacterium]|nr:hypothetical protein [Polyangiaceae bacterium]
MFRQNSQPEAGRPVRLAIELRDGRVTSLEAQLPTWEVLLFR